MENTVLTKSAAWYNPMFIDNELEVNRIVFYSDGREIAAVKWFGSNNAYERIELPCVAKRALKVNLGRKDAFYVRAKQPSWEKTKKYDLFIHESLVGLEFNGTSEYGNTWYHTGKKDDFTATIRGVRRKHVLQEDGRPKSVTEEGEFAERFSCNYVFTDTEEAEICKEIAEDWNRIASHSVSFLDIHEIMQHYKIEKL